MFFRLVVVLALSVIAGHCAPVDPEVFKKLVDDPKFFDYYKQNAAVSGVDDDVGFGNYMMTTIKKYKDWQSKLQDPSSPEYLALVAAQNGNPTISTDQKQLLSQYLETLYGNDKSSTTQTVNSPTSTTSLPEITSRITNSQAVSSTIKPTSTENPSISAIDFAEFDKLDKQVQQPPTTVVSEAPRNIINVPHTQPNHSDGTSNSQTTSESSFSNEDLAELSKLDSQYRPSQNIKQTSPSTSSSNQNRPMNRNNNNALSDIIARLDTTTRPIMPVKVTLQEQEKDKIQALQAEYSYAYQVNDNIRGNSQQRVEKRKNGKVYGKYSYDDGNYFVTRYYIADGNGFRIIKENSVPSVMKNNPLTGEASVQYTRDGMKSGYNITANDIKGCGATSPSAQ